MATCPFCLGAGEHDFRDSDAMVAERFSDAELALIERQGFRRRLGVLECPECEGSGEVGAERARDVEAASVALVDQAMARLRADGLL